MLNLKTVLTTILSGLGLSLLAMPVAQAQDDVTVTNIANVIGAKESHYASVRGWNIVTGTVKGRVVYCAAEKVIDKSKLRLGYDGGQWQMAAPYSAKRGEYVGQMELDRKLSGTYGVSDGKWTFLWLNLGERDALMNGKQVTIDIGKMSFDYNLYGAAAAGLKVAECANRRIRPA